MTPTPVRTRAAERRLFGAALWLYPPAFRREYAGEILRDFDDARDEACAAGRRSALWRMRLQMAIDLARSLGIQWVRTGLPLICLVSAVAPLLAAAALASLAARVRFTIPAELDQAELFGVMVLATTSLLVIAMTIALTIWAARPFRRVKR